MSSRVLRRLREEKEAALAADGDGPDESSEEEEDDVGGGGGNKAFLSMLEEGSSSEEESSSESEDEADDGDEDDADARERRDRESAIPAAASAGAAKTRQDKAGAKAAEQEEEDLDAILSDMNLLGGDQLAATAAVEPPAPPSVRALLLSKARGFDVQDLDLDYAMRSLLAGGGGLGAGAVAGGGGGPPPPPRRGGGRGGGRHNPRGRRTLARRYLFGRPKEDWGKPPSYVGGGLGHQWLTAAAREEERHAWAVPWPYAAANDSADAAAALPPPAAGQQRWCTLTMSDTYLEQQRVYEELLSSRDGGGGRPAAGADPNALAMFVADYPYFAETLLQLAMVLYHVDERTRAHELLRRCLFLYETALPAGALPGGDEAEDGSGGGEVLIDVDRPPNANLFAVLFRIMQTSGMTGCIANALATGRYLLSLDPLRDPMGTLVILDYYALCDAGVGGPAFVVDLVESRRITLHHKNPLTDRHHQCELTDMPNWSYSYALALYRLSLVHEAEDEDPGTAEETRYMERAEAALVRALSQFPGALPKLLAMNQVSPQDRSLQGRDWHVVLPHFEADATPAAGAGGAADDRAARACGERLVGIFARRCHTLWKEDDAMGLLYRCAARVARRRPPSPPAPVAGDGGDGKEVARHEAAGDVAATDEAAPCPLTPAFSPALARYAQCDPSDYEDAFHTIPPEAIALDPNLIAAAMALGVPMNRGRFLRRARQQQPHHHDFEGRDPLVAAQQLLGLGGHGHDDMEVLDPDSPLLQLYLQSLLPWAQVEGVRPPPRD